MPNIVFTRSNQEELRDVHKSHFQNVSINGVTIMDMLRGENMPLGVDGTLNDFRAAVVELGATTRPSFRQFEFDLTRVQGALLRQDSSYVNINAGGEFNDVPLGQLLAMCWNLVYRHRERRDAAIRMVQEISEGIEQHPAGSSGCGPGRSPRLINALRGFVDVGFQTVAAINMPTFQIEFANRVANPDNLSHDQRLAIAKSVCAEYGVVGQLRAEWLNSVTELFSD